MNVLCIGPGISAIEHQDFAQFNNFDYKIGCRELLCDPAWAPLDYIVTYRTIETRWVLNTYPELSHKIITPLIDQQFVRAFNLCPLSSEIEYITNDNLYSIQARTAIHLKATHITTIGWDILEGSIKTIEDTRFREDHPIQTHVVNRRVVNERIKKLTGTLNTIKHNNSHIRFEHRTSVLSTA